METSGWRTVIINNRAKLSLSNDNLKIAGDERSTTVPLSQIRNIMINTGEATLTAFLISELNHRNIKIIFCDDKHLPCCEVCGYSSNVYAAGHHFKQMSWSEKRKSEVWAKIVKQKIMSQSAVLKTNYINDSGALRKIAESVNPENALTQEAFAARLYFNLLFGGDFNRRTVSLINDALNYGYAIILSDISRAVVLHGYLTSIGINHCSQKNPFNLSCDIMEPFRAYVDNYVYQNPPEVFDWDYKRSLVDLSLSEVKYSGKKTELHTAVELYVNDVLTELSEGTNRIKELDFYE